MCAVSKMNFPLKKKSFSQRLVQLTCNPVGLIQQKIILIGYLLYVDILFENHCRVCEKENDALICICASNNFSNHGINKKTKSDFETIT